VNLGEIIMILKIAEQQTLINFLSLRFILSLLLTILLFSTSGFVFVSKYKQQADDYWEDTNKYLSDLGEKSNQLDDLTFHNHDIWRKPRPLTFCAEGFEKFFPNNFKFTVFRIDYPEVNSRGNFLLARFSDIDWVFVISVILSFAALLFTYDSICGEREAGTLRLMLAGSTARHKILLGKYLGAMFTLGVSLLIGLFINLIIIVVSNVFPLGFAEWLKIVTVGFLSVAFLSIFVLLGIFISCRTAYSVNSMVILLLIWVGLVILIPSGGRIVATIFHTLPTEEELARTRSEAVQQVVDNANADKYGRNAFQNDPDLKSPRNNPPARASFTNAVIDVHNRIVEGHHNQMVAQAFTGRNFTCISPTVIYQYIRDKDAEDPESLHLLFREEVTVKNWGAISKKPVDFDTVPKFQERDLGLSQSLKLAIWDIGLLALFNLVFFSASFVSFLRYDVR